MTWVNNDHFMLGVTHDRDGEGHADFWGIRWVRQGLGNRVAENPLAAASPDQVRKYCFPLQHVEELLSRLSPFVASAYEHFVGCDVSPCVCEMYRRLRGPEQALADLNAEPALVDEMFDRCAAFAALLAELACRRFPLDWLWTGDAAPTQTVHAMSPDAWRRLVKPHLQLVFDVGKRHRLWVGYRGCGDLRPVIPDLVEMGLDVLSLAHGACPTADPLELKREFGAKLAFLGGLDAHFLCRGSVDEVRRATRQLVDGMTGHGGGYVLAATDFVLPETPADNLFAMYTEAGVSREEIYDRAAEVRAKYRQNR
jgi:uroporphyrinogen decarboxylase